jgi:hypothetical protein
MFSVDEVETEIHRRVIEQDVTSLPDKTPGMKFRFLVFGLVALPLGAHAYDIDAYCKQVGAAAGNGSRLEAACREREQTAKAEIGRMSVPPGILNYCRQVGQSAGGSYQFMEACIKEESMAKDKLE